jgi:hypothetical protein
MIVSTAKVIFFAMTILVSALTVGALIDVEINWQVKYALIAITLGCIGNITNWRRRPNNVLDLRLHKGNL